MAETALLLPLLLILLAGGWWAFRNLSVSSAAESAAHAHLLRTGRGISSIASKISPTLHSDGDRVRINGGNRSLSTKLPLFGGVSGNTNAYAAVSFPREQVGGFIDLPDHDIRREAEGAVDCWGKNSRSGSTVRGTVLGILATGAFR
jgi:hypothetical protein